MPFEYRQQKRWKLEYKHPQHSDVYTAVLTVYIVYKIREDRYLDKQLVASISLAPLSTLRDQIVLPYSVYTLSANKLLLLYCQSDKICFREKWRHTSAIAYLHTI